MDWSFPASILQIVLIDLALSGDNAVAIALASHRLPARQRRLAILCGAGAAVVLRVLFTVAVARLLSLPLVRLAGGLALIWIAVKLLVSEEAEAHQTQPASTLGKAVWTIIVADLSMSLENMLAVGGASKGDVKLLAFGLILSIAVIMTASSAVAQLMNRFPVVVTLGAGVLGLTAGEMIVQDPSVASRLAVLPHARWAAWAIVLAVTAAVVASPGWLRGSAQKPRPPAGTP